MDDDQHLSYETILRLLSGRVRRDELLREVLPHHLEHCAACREGYRELLRRQQAGQLEHPIPILEGWEPGGEPPES
jgi:hypothetical protein